MYNKVTEAHYNRLCMRKLITITFLLSLSKLVFSSPGVDLEISIQNAGATDCVLKNQYLILGHIASQTTVPEVIFRGQTAVFKMLSEDTNSLAPLNIAIVLNYECDIDREITFLSILNKTLFSYKILDAKNMRASGTREAAYLTSHFTAVPWKIHWILNNQS